jgi:hypothetical protein
MRQAAPALLASAALGLRRWPRWHGGRLSRSCGKPGMAPIGYLNVREPLPQGGEIRTIIIDQKRAEIKVGVTKLWWARQDSNLRPIDYESTALTN